MSKPNTPDYSSQDAPEPHTSPHRAGPSSLPYWLLVTLGIVWFVTNFLFGGPIEVLMLGGNLLIGAILVLVGLIGVGATRSVRGAKQRTPVSNAMFNPRTNSLAVVALVLGFVFPLAAIPVGHIARAQIRSTGEQGDGLALAGLVLAYLWVAIAITAVIVLVVAGAQ